ncbi:MAG TPA: ABATE domain-containing protein [Gemmatimonadota bacterium]|nr:ABATE domain-containing protein [Gemmatimonadota bacterium]
MTAAPERSAAEPVFDLSGGVLCLDFVNTLGNRAGPEPLEERLERYDDLVGFARQSGALDGTEARRLREAARARPPAAAAMLARAVSLREVLHAIFGALAAGNRPVERDLAGLNAELAPALAHARLARGDGGYTLTWDAAPADAGAGGIPLDRPLWPIAHSAMQLLLEADLSRVGECGSDTCGFLFLDTTRNRSRRWCDTRICGNRARVRRHRRRMADGE